MADMSQHSEIGSTPSEAQKKMERAVWFFRTGDLTSWNYAILALCFAGLFLGLFLLGRNILLNRKRKMIEMYQRDAGPAQPAVDEKKQAFVTMEKDIPSTEDTLLKKELQPGAIAVQWKDGNVTSLYTELPEEDV
ncbi:hypothetical protein FKM82_004877 [Ascaphus truei]|uniref:organic solute transporter subunit beta n=1 Tax=Ascaphus truei TaxID=8439 RepID=UPI003F598D57